MSKPALAFQPTPRPRPLSNPQETEKLVEATHDLGFGRQTAAPQPAVKAAPAPVPAPSPEPHAAPKTDEAALRKPAALKFDVPDELWDDLRMAAIRRRVTVKYLVLEALEAKGYAVDLAAIPEDGRRLR